MKRNRSIWEANIWEATAIKATSSRSRASVTQTLPTIQERQPTFHSSNQEPQGVRFRTSDIRTQQLDCGHSTWPASTATWPSESEHVSKSNVKHKIATASDLVPVEHQRAVGLVRTRTLGRKANPTEERFRLSRTHIQATSRSSRGRHHSPADSSAASRSSHSPVHPR